MKIHVIKALAGDCLLVDFENGKCVLIDGGYRDTYRALKQKLTALSAEGKRLE